MPTQIYLKQQLHQYQKFASSIYLLTCISADEDKTFGGNLDRLNTRAILTFDGNTTWLAPIMITSQCAIDVKYFPFDTQNCHMKFGSWTYSKNSLDLHKEKDHADTSKLMRFIMIYSFMLSPWFKIDATVIFRNY